MTEHEGHEKTTAELADAILQSYRERKDAEPATDGTVNDGDAEAQAGALADAAARLAWQLAALTAQHRSHNPVTVLHGLSEAAGSIAAAAGELHRQGLINPGNEETREAWYAALAGLHAAEGTFRRAADGEI